MSFALDVNILLYASDSASPLNVKATSFIETCMRQQVLFYLAWPTLMGYLRMATHPGIFDHPLTPAEAMSNVEALLNLPHVRCIAEAEGFWETYREITAGAPVRGNLVPDAHLATLLRQHGIGILYTHDRDFRRFPFLDVRDPLG